MKDNICVPLDVPPEAKGTYIFNFQEITRKSGRLMLFAGDQKIEHLNDDFYGDGIPKEDGDPEHLFRIAAQSPIGAFATQLGLISKYGDNYRNIPYVVKLNSKSNLVKTSQADPYSGMIASVEDVIAFKKIADLKILGVGYTIYLGSEYENLMLKHAAQIIRNAHKQGLIVILWIYPRGKAVTNERDPHLIAGATGVAACLGADFVKVNYPDSYNAKEDFKEAIRAAGRTGVICAGGSSVDVGEFLKRLYDQIQAGAVGNATGRNIHQKTLPEAVRLCKAIYSITVEGKCPEEAISIYKGNDYVP
ncbi:MAG: aldolase [Candidatus Cloacimonetes bacterium]|nr:aldolase [Candidatus Cloacimonadota bacterium]